MSRKYVDKSKELYIITEFETQASVANRMTIPLLLSSFVALSSAHFDHLDHRGVNTTAVFLYPELLLQLMLYFARPDSFELAHHTYDGTL